MEELEFSQRNPLKKVLILGAGASIAYGFPSGAQLVTDIVQYCKDNWRDLEIIIDSGAKLTIPSKEHIRRFIEDLENSGRTSIDAFLKDRPEYIFIGKLTIAGVLRNKENPEQLRKAENDWYLLLIESIFNGEKNKIPFHNTTIITFNYDRSFKERCYQTLKARGWKPECAKKALESFNIIHVYGRLALLDWEVGAAPYRISASAYGGEFHQHQYTSAQNEVSLLKIIGEDLQQVGSIQEILKQANEIYFMGFGYHPSNMEVLGFKEQSECQSKKHYGTCRGQNKENLEESYPYIQFEELNCIDFVKKYFS